MDRFHLSTLAWQAAAGRNPDFGWLEDRLRPLGFHVVLCTRREGTFEEARAARLTVSGNPGQYDDLQAFVREQDLLRQLAERSTLPVLEIDTTDGDLDGACTMVAAWMTDTGGLWAP